jgi:hypothetical protein
VRVENVLRGVESRKAVDVYEIYWMGGTSGDWNATEAGERDLFMVRTEGGYYHVVRDWWRSILPITSGPHVHLPLDDSHPFWERLALMNFWVERSDDKARISYPYFNYADPAYALSRWRMVKLERGLVRHPSAGVRVPACRELILSRLGQDECWEMLSESDKVHLADSGYCCMSAREIAAARLKFRDHDPSSWWATYTERDSRRMLTAVSDREARLEFCRLYAREYPGDPDTGCPADQSPPATIVTERGDVPLAGSWPR